MSGRQQRSTITYRAALRFPELLRDPRLVDETCTMVRRYLGVAEG